MKKFFSIVINHDYHRDGNISRGITDDYKLKIKNTWAELKFKIRSFLINMDLTKCMANQN